MNCHRHPTAESSATCVACDQPICQECREGVAGYSMCHPCVAAAEARLAQQSASTEVTGPIAGTVSQPAAVADSTTLSTVTLTASPEVETDPAAPVVNGTPPGPVRRITRGMLWGILYGQWWTLWTIIAGFLWGQAS